VTGASGTIGVGRVVRAAADGYTLLYVRGRKRLNLLA